jgi:hypothetical protein
MKKSFGSILSTFLISIVLFTACGEAEFDEASLKNSRRFNMINSLENIMIVGSVDLLGLIEKSDFENSKDAPFEAVAGYKMMVKGNLDAELTGINLSGNNHVAVSMIDEDTQYVIFTAEITNQEKVKNTLKDLKIFKGEYSKVEEGGKIFEFLADDNVTAAWDDKDIVIVAGENINSKDKALALLKARYVDAPGNDALDGFLKQKDDMNVFVNIATAMTVAKNNRGGESITDEMIEVSKDAYYIGTGNFNKGEILFEANVFGDNFKNSNFNAIGNTAVSESFLNYLTNDKLVAFGAASFDMKAVFNAMEMVQNNDFDFQDLEKATGLSKEDMQNLLTGEFSLSLMDIKTEKVSWASEFDAEDDFFEEDDYTYDKTTPMILFAAGVNDTAKIGELIRTSGEVSVSNGVYNVENDMYIAFTADKMVVTTDEATAVQFSTGNLFKSYSLPGGLTIEKPLFGFYNTNPAQMPNGVLKMAENEEGQMMLEFANLFKLVDFQGDVNKMTFKVEMNNKNDNALKVITDYIIGVVKDKQLM